METVNNFFSLISEKTDDFSGREWVFNEINNWLNYDPVNRQRYQPAAVAVNPATDQRQAHGVTL